MWHEVYRGDLLRDKPITPSEAFFTAHAHKRQ